jgi:hypothetical protein
LADSLGPDPFSFHDFQPVATPIADPYAVTRQPVANALTRPNLLRPGAVVVVVAMFAAAVVPVIQRNVNADSIPKWTSIALPDVLAVELWATLEAAVVTSARKAPGGHGSGHRRATTNRQKASRPGTPFGS